MAVLSFAGVTALLIWRKPFAEALSPTTLTVLLGAGCGGLGAMFSILLRVGRATLDSSAGRLLHYVEGGARILAGVIGAGICVLAIKAGVLLEIVNESRNQFFIFFLCCAAGSSERLLPTFIRKVELHITEDGETYK